MNPEAAAFIIAGAIGLGTAVATHFALRRSLRDIQQSSQQIRETQAEVEARQSVQLLDPLLRRRK